MCCGIDGRHRRTTPPALARNQHQKSNTYYRADVFLPDAQSGQLLRTVVPGEHRTFVLKHTQRLMVRKPYKPTITRLTPVDEEDQTLIDIAANPFGGGRSILDPLNLRSLLFTMRLAIRDFGSHVAVIHNRNARWRVEDVQGPFNGSLPHEWLLALFGSSPVAFTNPNGVTASCPRQSVNPTDQQKFFVKQFVDPTLPALACEAALGSGKTWTTMLATTVLAKVEEPAGKPLLLVVTPTNTNAAAASAAKALRKLDPSIVFRALRIISIHNRNRLDKSLHTEYDHTAILEAKFWSQKTCLCGRPCPSILKRTESFTISEKDMCCHLSIPPSHFAKDHQGHS
uniref:Uncharacterized protein n=1 Tax=Caenorhabditis japonica TaxID=281687 RepID=A0A8R1I6F3_CAEJA